MERQVEDYIHNLSDIDLLEYTRCKTHLLEAIEFAQTELKDRHLSSERMGVLEKKLKHRLEQRLELAREIAAEPLNAEWRLVIFLSGLYLGIPLLFFIPAWKRYRQEGANQKCKDMCIFAVAGLFMLPILALLHIPPWSWLLEFL